MKKLSFKLILPSIVLTVLVSGCTKKVGWVGNNFPGKFAATFYSFDGTDQSSISADIGEIIVVNYESEIEKGELTIELLDPKDNVIVEFEPGTKGVEKIEVKTAGKHKLLVTGDDAKGEFGFTWEVK